MAITPSEALVRCIEHREIFHDEMLSLWRKLMSGEKIAAMGWRPAISLEEGLAAAYRWFLENQSRARMG